jgi:glycine oxidase
MENGRRHQVVVVGGGVIGLAVAWQAAEAGMAVTVVDPSPGRGASWAAAGMLAPVGEAHFGEEAHTRLHVQAAEAWPEFARALEAASGTTVEYTTGGTLMVAVDPSDLAVLDDLLGYHRSVGLPVSRLGARALRQAEPLLAPGVRGGADLVGDHQVDNRKVVEALEVACRAAGVTFVEDEVTRVVVEAGRAEGVVVAGGDRLPGTVVVAAGCRSGQLGGLPATVLPPVRPVKGLTLRLRAGPGVPVLQRTVRGLVHGRSCYLVPRPDRTLVVGATAEEKGFDLRVQAGAVGDLLDDARRLVPAIEEYELVDTTTGLRPGSPDNGPIVGATAVDGLIMATGHYRNGFLLAPLTALAVTEVLTGPGPAPAGTAAAALAPFGPGRLAAVVDPVLTPVPGPPAPSETIR